LKNKYEIRGDITAIFLNRRDGTILEALIDTEDLSKADSYEGTWYAAFSKDVQTFYVGIFRTLENGTRPKTLLHRLLLDPAKGKVVDHINHNGLDNTRNNLRVVNTSENMQNRKGPQVNNKLGIRNVKWNKRNKNYVVSVISNKNPIHIGCFNAIEEAEKAAIEARKKYLPYAN